MMIEENTSPVQIAVIMSSYNERPEWLRLSIESILKQTFKDFHFYIVLDNPENDELNTLVGEYAQQDNRIIVLRNEKNLGLTKSLNRAIAASNERYIARMDADDIALPERLAEEIKFLNDNNLDFVSAGTDIMANGDLLPGRRLANLYPEALKKIEGFTNVMFHPTWMIKREVFTELSGYREIDACEDYDFVLRALQQGFKLGRIGKTLLNYRFSDSGISYLNYIKQELAAKFLRNEYRKGTRLSEISVDEINKVSASFSEKDEKKYADAKRDYDNLFSKLGNHDFIGAAPLAIKGILVNSIFREKIRNSILDRVMITCICKKHNHR